MSSLIGTEKQVAYAKEVKTRLLQKIQKAVTEIQDFIAIERSLNTQEQEIIKAIRHRYFGDVLFNSAFSLAKKDVAFTNSEKYLELLNVAIKYLDSLKSAAEVLDKGMPENTTVFLSHVVKMVKFTNA